MSSRPSPSGHALIANHSRFNTRDSFIESPRHTARAIATSHFDPSPSSPSSPLFTVHPQRLNALPNLVNQLSLILDEDSPSVSDRDSSSNMPSPAPVGHSSPVTLSQLLARLPRKRQRPRRKSVNDGEDFNDVSSVSASSISEAEMRTKIKKRPDEKLAKGDESSHLRGDEHEAYMRKRDDRLAHYRLQIDPFKLHTEDVIWI